MALSVTVLFVYEISREPLDGFAPNSHGRRVWSLARESLKVKVKGQGHQGQKTAFSALSAACVRFVFGKTSLAQAFRIGLSATFVPRNYHYCDFFLQILVSIEISIMTIVLTAYFVNIIRRYSVYCEVIVYLYFIHGV